MPFFPPILGRLCSVHCYIYCTDRTFPRFILGKETLPLKLYRTRLPNFQIWKFLHFYLCKIFFYIQGIQLYIEHWNKLLKPPAGHQCPALCLSLSEHMCRNDREVSFFHFVSTTEDDRLTWRLWMRLSRFGPRHSISAVPSPADTRIPVIKVHHWY